MMLQVGDGGVVSAVNEDNLIYIDENELDELIDRYNCLKEENEQLKETIEFIFKQIESFRDDCRTYQDVEGASAITELIRILEDVKE